MNAAQVVASIETLAKQTGSSGEELRTVATDVANWILTQLVLAGYREDVNFGIFVAKFSADGPSEWDAFGYHLRDVKGNEIAHVCYEPLEKRLTPIRKYCSEWMATLFADALEQILKTLRELLESRRCVLKAAADKLAVKL